MSKRELLNRHRPLILALAARHGARNVRVAGSVARGDETEGSDVDFLVEMEAGRSLLDRASLLVELEDLLGCKVDVVNERGTRPRIREALRRDAVLL